MANRSSHTRRSALAWALSILSFFIGTVSPTAGASPSDPSPAISAGQKSKAETLTLTLGNLIARYRASNPSEKAGLADPLMALAEERRQLLLELIETDAAAVLRLALPDELRVNLPSGVKKLLEQPMELEGELEVLHVDHDDAGQSHYLYFLNAPFGDRFSLHFAKGGIAHVTGALVRVSGLMVPRSSPNAGGTDGALAIESADSDVEVLALGSDPSAGTPASGLTNTFGEQRTVALLVNFQDKPGEKPWTTTQIGAVVNGTTGDFFKENSYQQTWLNAEVYGWYTLPLSSTTCVISDIEKEAKAKATAAGVNLAAYSRYIYLFPANTACPWSGVGTVGGDPSRAWINGQTNWWVYAHELGHNFGLFHSNALECGAASVGDGCTVVEYGDKADLMGSPTQGHFNAFQKERLGWLGFGSSPPLLQVDVSGSYLLDGYAPVGGGPKALKVLRSTDPATGSRTWYYVEYRQPFGFDSNLAVAMNSNVYDGAVVHSGSESTGNSSHLLDMTPETTSWFDPALNVDDSHVDAGAGVTITTDWVNGTQASVSVNLGASACVKANPQVALSPGESPWVPAGTPVTYTVTVTSKEGADCANSTFALTSALPSGWSGVFDSASLSLAPGASGSRTLTVTSPDSTADGFYNVTATATNAAASSYKGSASATYVVSSAGANQPPVAGNDSAATQSGTPVVIPVLANDFDPDGDPLSIQAVTQGVKGSVTINPDKSVTYTPGAKFRGSDTFSYTISDGKAIASATVTVSKSRR